MSHEKLNSKLRTTTFTQKYQCQRRTYINALNSTMKTHIIIFIHRQCKQACSILDPSNKLPQYAHCWCIFPPPRARVAHPRKLFTRLSTSRKPHIPGKKVKNLVMSPIPIEHTRARNPIYKWTFTISRAAPKSRHIYTLDRYIHNCVTDTRAYLCR